jgi:Zn-dependent protease with chaperone function
VIDEARNRARIGTLILLAVVNYCIAAVIGATATGVVIVIWILAHADGLPDSLQDLEYLGIGALAIVVVSAVVGGIVAVVRIPTLRRRLEAQIVTDTHTKFVDPDSLPRVRNLLDGLAIAAGISTPRFGVVDDPAPNSFGVGTKPDATLIGVTTGLIDTLSRDELEAVLAYEITRVASWDVAMATWTAALTGSALAKVDASSTAIFGAPNRWLAVRLQTWALRDEGRQRDAAAMAVCRNPASLVRALEKLAADPATVGSITTATAPLWIEVPESLVVGADASPRKHAAALGPLLLSERIAHLRELAHLAPPPAPTTPAPPPADHPVAPPLPPPVMRTPPEQHG